MRNLALFMLLLAMPSAARATDQSVILIVDNMTCSACPITVRTAIKRVAGVKQVRVDFAKKTAVVVFDDAVAKPPQFAEASRLAGFPARVKE